MSAIQFTRATDVLLKATDVTDNSPALASLDLVVGRQV